MCKKRVFGLVAVLAIVATFVFSDDIVTTTGTTYSNAKVTKRDPLGVKILHKSGVSYVTYAEMLETDKKKYGYDAKQESDLLAEKRMREEANIAAKQSQKEAVELAQKEAEEKVKKEQAILQQKERDKLVAEEKAKQEEAEKLEREIRDRFKPSGMSVAAFHALKSTGVTVFVANAKLADYFNWEFSETEHKLLSVRLETLEGETIGYGYKRLWGKAGDPLNETTKNERGWSLFNLLFDGKWHSLIVRVKYSTIAESSDCFFLDDYKEITGE